tara:strand:+ start:114 stop:656 length:543 start_codon:yes stop_codon:yes gene_type:complete
MLEIFAIPYLAISGVIGWLIFQPFLPAHQSESLLPAKITITDLLAISLPISIVFSFTRVIAPLGDLSGSMQATVAVTALLVAIPWLAAGLFLVPKTFQVTFFKRVTIMGFIAPFGILLTVGWIGFLIWACAYSLLYSVPSTVAIAAATLGLRMLSFWVCQDDPKAVVERAADQGTVNEDT